MGRAAEAVEHETLPRALSIAGIPSSSGEGCVCAGLQKLWEMKDNHIFRGLATLAAPGTTLSQATSTGKDVLQVRSDSFLLSRFRVTTSLAHNFGLCLEVSYCTGECDSLLVDLAGI
jgi:hypothetical protein